MIENAIYARLSGSAALAALAGTRIYPTTPTENTQLPLVVYTVSSAEPQLHTTGITGLTKYTFDVDIWAVNLDDTLAIGDECKAALHPHRGGVFQGVFMTNYNLAIEEEGFHQVQSYVTWATA